MEKAETTTEKIINVITIFFLLVFLSMVSFFVTLAALSLIEDETTLVEPVQTNGSSITEKESAQPSPSLLNCQKEVGIQDRMGCVNDYVKSIFIYKIRDDKEIINRMQLITEGGDCGNWADFYIDIGRELGYQGDDFGFCVVNKTTKKTRCHKAAFVFNDEAYCTLDQTDIHCFKFGIRNETIIEVNQTEVNDIEPVKTASKKSPGGDLNG